MENLFNEKQSMFSVSQSLQDESIKIGLTKAQINILNYGHHTLDAIKQLMLESNLTLAEAYDQFKCLNYIQVEGMTNLGLSRNEVENKHFNEISLKAIETSMKRGLSKDEALRLFMIPVVQVHEKLNDYLDQTKIELDALSTFTEIRIIVYNGQGYGNQRAALILMGQLRSFGFNGLFDVWCEDKEGTHLMLDKAYRYNDEKIVTKRMLQMLPNLKSLQDDLYEDNVYGQMRLSSLPHDFKTNKDFQLSLKPLDLCISGAEDGNGFLHIKQKKANLFNVKLYISLQPTDWVAGGGNSFIVDNFEVVMPLIDQKTSRLSCSIAFNFSVDALNEKELKIFKCLESPNNHSQLVYGIYDRQGALSPQIQFERIINAHLVLAEKTNKTSILLVPQKKLYTMLERFDTDEVLVLDVDEIKQDSLDINEHKKIIILKTDSLSVHYFDYLMGEGTTLPAIIEGCNSVEFCESHGIPFLHGGSLHDPIHPYNFTDDGYEIRDSYLFLFSQVKEYVKYQDLQALHLTANQCLEKGDEACEPAMVAYMLESLEPSSKVKHYHEARHGEYIKRPDAVEAALVAAGIAFNQGYDQTFADAPKLK